VDGGRGLSDASRMRMHGTTDWLFIAHLLHPWIDRCGGESPGRQELERQDDGRGPGKTLTKKSTRRTTIMRIRPVKLAIPCHGLYCAKKEGTAAAIQ